MKYYKIENGIFAGFYDRSIHGDIVDDKEFFEISDEEWKTLLDTNGEIFLKHGVLVSEKKCRETLISEDRITLDTEIGRARKQRKKEFSALDILDAKVAVGRDSLTIEEKLEIDTWYETWRNLPNNYINIELSIEESYPERPSKIDYYYKGE